MINGELLCYSSSSVLQTDSNTWRHKQQYRLYLRISGSIPLNLILCSLPCKKLLHSLGGAVRCFLVTPCVTVKVKAGWKVFIINIETHFTFRRISFCSFSSAQAPPFIQAHIDIIFDRSHRLFCFFFLSSSCLTYSCWWRKILMCAVLQPSTIPNNTVSYLGVGGIMVLGNMNFTSLSRPFIVCMPSASAMYWSRRNKRVRFTRRK